MANSKYPLFVLHKKRVLDRYNKLKDLGLKVSYSVKTNPSLVKVLEDKSDSWFSVHFIKELEIIKDKKRVWFFGLGWSEEDLEKLFELGVRNFVVDLVEDFEVLVRFIKKKKEKINLLLRMKMRENTMATGKHYVFGLDSGVVDYWLTKLRDNEFIGKLGIHFHRKTQNFSEWNLKSDIEESLSEKNLERIDMINIGGGLPGKYKNFNDRGLESVFDKIKEFKDWVGKEVWVEPGRFIASGSVDVECEVIAVQGNTIFVNWSIFNGALDTVVANVKLLVDGELEKGSREQRFLIKGITPASEDILRYEVYFSDKPKVGDVIRFLNAGAYTYSSDFCFLDKPGFVIENN